MAIDCSDIPTNITYDCTNPWGQNCTSDERFHFTTLWKYTWNIQNACATDTRLFIPRGGITSPRHASLNQASCKFIAGPDWKRYPAADIWTRLTTWKFPLLQLVASFPRPPLSFSVECFVILHLLGDPVDTMKNLLAKMSACQDFAKYWRLECEELLDERAGDDEDRNWKALALITDAYGEWERDVQARQILQQGLHDNHQHISVLASAIRQTGRALAADRSTKSLPIIVAEAFFIGAIGAAIFKTASAAGASASSDTIFINVEAHSIAFSALYFWIIPAVFLGSIIGVSQTEAAIPRILRRFQVDIKRLKRLKLLRNVKLPNDCLDDKAERIFHGGIYSWQPQKCQPWRDNLLAYLVVVIGTVTGMVISALVPPDGWDCRHIGQILILFAWLLSAQVDVFLCNRWRLNKHSQSKLFWTTGIKDLLFTIATMGGIIATQVGVFNRCSCYTLWGRTGLALPEMPDVAETLFYRINTAYPAVTFTSIGIELIVVPLFICIRYRGALRTFIQRDDRKSNAAWLWKTLKRYPGVKARLQETFSRKTLTLSKLKRTSTSAIEGGLSSESTETHPLAQTRSGEFERINTGEASVESASAAVNPSGSTGSISESSGVDSPSRSVTDMSSMAEPRRRNTEREGDVP